MAHFGVQRQHNSEKMMIPLGASMKLCLHQQKQREGNQMVGSRIISNGGLRVGIMDVVAPPPIPAIA